MTAAARFFDDLAVGLSDGAARGVVVDEVEVMVFARLSGDRNPLHVDEHHAAATPFGRRIAHGLLGTSIASGLFTETALSRSLQPALIAMLQLDVRFLTPIFLGDALSLRATVTNLRPCRDGARGVATIERRLLNQDGVEVQRIVTPLLLARRAARAQ